jgi:hypothetical protein
MLEAFVEWLKESLGPPPIIVVVLLTFACITFILISYLVGEPSPATNDWRFGVFWLALISEISKIVLAAIVTGAVLKALVVGGFFEKVVADIIFEERGLEILSSERHAEIWRSLTARIYAPSFRHGHRAPPNIQDLYRKISLSSGKLIEYTKDFYVQRATKELTPHRCPSSPFRRLTTAHEELASCIHSCAVKRPSTAPSLARMQCETGLNCGGFGERFAHFQLRGRWVQGMGGWTA